MEKFDIVIQAGQSNAEGMGIGEVERKYEENENIFHLNAEKTVEYPPERVTVTFADKPFSLEVADEREYTQGKLGDFSLSFSCSYIKNGLLSEDRKLLIVRAAIGGTGFQKGHWTKDGELYLKMLEMCDYALDLNPENRIVGFLWHQGEHDALEGNSPENYYNQLSELVQTVRNRYGKIPFIAGDFVKEWKTKNITICQPIVDVIKKVVKDMGNAGFVETSDLLSNNEKTGNGDDIHFCRDALYELGNRYFDEFSKLYE